MRLTGLVIAMLAASLPAVASPTILRRSPKFVPKITYECASGAELSITESGTTIAVVGACARVTVAGRDDAVKIATAVELVVTGNDNSTSISEPADVVDVRGDDNIVRACVEDCKTVVRNTGSNNNIYVGSTLIISLH